MAVGKRTPKNATLNAALFAAASGSLATARATIRWLGVDCKLAGRKRSSSAEGHPDIRRQEVIEVFYMFDRRLECVDMWAVAYDEDNLLDDRMLTDIDVERKTIWVNQCLQDQKQKRERAVARANCIWKYHGYGSSRATDANVERETSMKVV